MLYWLDVFKTSGMVSKSVCSSCIFNVQSNYVESSVSLCELLPFNCTQCLHTIFLFFSNILNTDSL
jgi:hypothetical protein